MTSELESNCDNVSWAIDDLVVIVPYFFEEDLGTIKVTSNSYVDMLCNFLQLKGSEHVNQALWIEQDGDI